MKAIDQGSPGSLGVDREAIALATVHQFAKELFWIRTYAEKLEKDPGDRDDTLRSARAIRGLVDDMSDSVHKVFSTTNGFTLTIKDCVAAATLRTARLHGPDRVRLVAPQESGETLVDAHMEEVLTILLDNSFRAPGSQGGVVVNVSVGSSIVIRVSDQGCGMHRHEIQACLSTRYTTRKAGDGFGFGLPLAIRTVKSLGGSLSMCSAPEKGTHVVVHLPTRSATPVPTATKSACDGPSN